MSGEVTYPPNPNAFKGSIRSEYLTDTNPPIGPMSNNETIAISVEFAREHNRHRDREVRRQQQRQRGANRHADQVTSVTCKITAPATVRLRAPIALSMPICGTFCSI